MTERILATELWKKTLQRLAGVMRWLELGKSLENDGLRGNGKGHQL